MTHECQCLCETVKALAERIARLEAEGRHTTNVHFENNGLSAETKVLQAGRISNLTIG